MNELISASRAQININPRYKSPSIIINNQSENGLLETANLNFSRFTKKQKDRSHTQWLNHLTDKPVLELITEACDEKQFTPINPAQLNCYQRLKKLLTSQNNLDNKTEQRKQSKLLDNVALIEDKINKAEAKHQELSKKAPKFNRYIRSHVVSQNGSSYESPFDSLNSTQKSMMTSKTNSLRKKGYRSPSNKSVLFKTTESKVENFHPSIKQMISQFKKLWTEKFLNHKKAQNSKTYEQFESKIEFKVEQKIQEIINFKLNKLYTAEQQNKSFKMLLLEKDLTIECLRKEMKIMQDKIISMEMQKEPEKEMVAYSKNVQQFFDNYKNIFGDVTLTELSNKLDFMEKIFLEKYSVEKEKHLSSFRSLLNEREEKQKALQKQIEQYQQQEKQLKNIISSIRKFDDLDNSYQKHEIHQKIAMYKLKCDELETLQKFIFSKYIQWFEKRSEGESKLIKMINGNTVENYQQMIEAMLEYNRNYGNTHKNIQSMTKILSIVQRLKKIIEPSKCYEKLVPIKVLEDVEVILQSKCQKRSKTKKLMTFVNISSRKGHDEYFKQNDGNFA